MEYAYNQHHTKLTISFILINHTFNIRICSTKWHGASILHHIHKVYTTHSCTHQFYFVSNTKGTNDLCWWLVAVGTLSMTQTGWQPNYLQSINLCQLNIHNQYNNSRLFYVYLSKLFVLCAAHYDSCTVESYYRYL